VKPVGQTTNNDFESRATFDLDQADQLESSLMHFLRPHMPMEVVFPPNSLGDLFQLSPIKGHRLIAKNTQHLSSCKSPEC